MEKWKPFMKVEKSKLKSLITEVLLMELPKNILKVVDLQKKFIIKMEKKCSINLTLIMIISKKKKNTLMDIVKIILTDIM